MKLKHRRVIYIVFIIAFFIIASITIIYAAGYSYNFKKGRIEKTGILYVESVPKGANISINGKFRDKTPARLTRLLPDAYSVMVEKEGYYSWEKELTVKSNLTTFSRDIVLFKKSLPINIIEGQINIFTVSPNQEKIVYSKIIDNDEELKLYNIKNDSNFLIKSFNTKNYNQIEFVAWSPNGQKALFKQIIGDFNKYLIVDVETLKVKELFDITRLNFDKVLWDQASDNYLYGLRNSILYQIDLVNNTTISLISANIQDFSVWGENIFSITKIGPDSFLNKNSLTDRTVNDAKKIKLPSPSTFKISELTAGYLTLQDEKTNDLIIIEEKAFTSDDPTTNVILQDQAKKVIWSKDGRKLMYYSDFEIWIFDFAKSQKTLITRFGEVINQVLWYPRHDYLIYQTKNSFHAIEAKDEEPKNSLKLAELSTINTIATDDNGKNLFFTGEIGNQVGIFRLEVQ